MRLDQEKIKIFGTKMQKEEKKKKISGLLGRVDGAGNPLLIGSCSMIAAKTKSIGGKEKPSVQCHRPSSS